MECKACEIFLTGATLLVVGIKKVECNAAILFLLNLCQYYVHCITRNHQFLVSGDDSNLHL